MITTKTWTLNLRFDEVRFVFLQASIDLYLSLGSKPVGVDCVAIDVSRLILFTVVLSI